MARNDERYRLRHGLDAAALFTLVGLVALRPLISESYEAAPSALTAAIGEIRDPRPVVTLVFNVLILAAAGAVALGRAIDPSAFRARTGLGYGAALVTVAAILSCVSASNKRLAINATIDWIGYVVLAVTLVQLLGQSLRRRLVLAAILASAAVQAVQCGEQYATGFDETWEHYQSIREEFWAKQNVPLDSSKVELYERRMLARESNGFLPHANVTGSYLVLCGLPALGLALRALRGVGSFGALGQSLIAVTLLVMGFTTKSLGAAISGLAAGGLWLGWILFRRWLEPRRSWVLVGGWLTATLGVVATVTYGCTFHRLPGWSLTFRWQYWTASLKMFLAHWMTGVGRENFGRHYLQFKSIQSPEEVANPHNFLVQAACDWGVAGLIGVVVMFVGVSCVLANPPRVVPDSAEDKRRNRLGWAWLVGLLTTVTLIRMPLLGTDEFYFLYYSTFETGVIWLVAFLVFGVVQARLGATPGLIAGLLAFVLHETINFALFVPGSAVTFFALLAVGIAERTAPVDVAARARRWCAPCLVGVAVVATVVVGLVPVFRSGGFMNEARRLASQPGRSPAGDDRVTSLFDQAAASDPWDPTPYQAQAEWLVRGDSAADGLRAALSALDQAGARDPASIQLARMRTAVLDAGARVTRAPTDFAAAVAGSRSVLQLYPASPSDWVSMGKLQLEAGETTGQESLLAEAAVSFQHALDLDDQRFSWETLRRFRPREREEIQTQLDRARVMGSPERH